MYYVDVSKPYRVSKPHHTTEPFRPRHGFRLRWPYQILPACMSNESADEESLYSSLMQRTLAVRQRPGWWACWSSGVVGVGVRGGAGSVAWWYQTLMFCPVSHLHNTAMSLNRIAAAAGGKQLTWQIPPSLHGCPVYDQEKKKTQPPLTVWITACQLCSIRLPLTLFSLLPHKRVTKTRTCPELPAREPWAVFIFCLLGQKGGGYEPSSGCELWSWRPTVQSWQQNTVLWCQGKLVFRLPMQLVCWLLLRECQAAFALGRCPYFKKNK